MIDINTSPDKLKQSILQEAMQGKLTQQSSQEGDASDLLQSINEEKQRLIKAGKIKKQKKLSPVRDDEIPFKIPNNWQWVHLIDVTNIIMGQSPKSKFVHEGVPDSNHFEFHQGKSYFGKNIIHKSNKVTTQSSRLIDDKYILMSVRAPVGDINMINRKIALGRGLCGISPINTNQLYLYYYLQTQKNLLIRKSTGSTFKAINKKIIFNELMPLPPLAEQKRIVSKLDELLPKVDSLKQSVDSIQSLRNKLPSRLRRSFLQSAMQGRLTQQSSQDGDASDLLQSIDEEKQRSIKAGKIKKQKKLSPVRDDEIPFDIPNNWQWVRLGNISLISSSSRVHQSDWKNAGIPFYRAREVVKLSQNKPIKNPIYIDEKTYNEKVTKSGKPQPNDILFTGVGTLGTSWIVDNRKFYFKDASVLLLNNLYNMNPSYLNYFFKSPMFNQQVKKNSKGTAVKTLTITNSSNLIIPLPPLAEQKRIVNKLDSMFEHINNM